MTTTTIHAATSDGFIESISFDSYDNARAGTDGPTAEDAGPTMFVGQITPGGGEYSVCESFLNFDVSALSGQAIDAATLSLWLVQDSSTTDFTLEARSRDWGNTLESADWVAGASLSGLTLLASIPTAGIGATGAYKALTSEAAILTAIATAAAGDGILRLMLCSSRTTAGTAPTGNEQVALSSSDVASTTQDPKLVVTHSTPAAASSPLGMRLGLGSIG